MAQRSGRVRRLKMRSAQREGGMMRTHAWLVLLAIGCHTHGGGAPSGGSTAPDAALPPPPGAVSWTIDIDESALNRYVTPVTATSWSFGGVATASEGLAGVTVAGSA